MTSVARGDPVELKTGPHILVRVVWYLLVGWWLTGVLLGLAWLIALTVIGLPISFWLVNRVPTVLTLRPRRERYATVTGANGVMTYRRVATEQTNLLVRIVYFVVIGWWVSALWMFVSYLLMLTVVGIPIGLLMANRLPFVFSLHRGYA